MKSNEQYNTFQFHRHITQSIYLITFDREEIKKKFKYNFHFKGFYFVSIEFG